METILRALSPRATSRVQGFIESVLWATFIVVVAAVFVSSGASSGFSGTVFTR